MARPANRREETGMMKKSQQIKKKVNAEERKAT